MGDAQFTLPAGTVVFELEGPFFFGAAERLEITLEGVHGHAEVLVLRLGQVPFIDATGMQTLWDLLDSCRRHGSRLVLSEARPNVLEKLRRAGLLGQLGPPNVIGDIRALEVQRI